MTEDDNELHWIDGASEEATLLAELSSLMLDKFENQEKLSAQDFDAIWYAHVNLTKLWQTALAGQAKARNGNLH